MKPRPVRRYRTPVYPTRLEALADPRLLEQSLPTKWRKNAVLAGAAVLFLAANAQVDAGEKTAKMTPKTPAVVAPIFEHGEGRGTTGCLAICPPAFLSEEEGLQVISEELSKYGFEFSERNVSIKGVKFFERELIFPGKDNSKGTRRTVFIIKEIPGTAKPFKIDLVDPKRRVAVEFVAFSDDSALGGVRSRFTVKGYNVKELAQRASAEVAKTAKGYYFGFLYDPMKRVDCQVMQFEGSFSFREAQERSVRKSKAMSQRQLRLQVEDFVDWLKAQGAL